MRWVVRSLLIYVVAVTGSARGSDVFFDFDALGRFDGSIRISEYMTGQYGSSITVDGARATTDRTEENDRFIATSLQLLDRGDFEILFDETPIVGIQFEGYVIDATIGDDFTMTLYNDDLPLMVIDVVVRNDGEEVFQSEWRTLPAPANRIVVSDSSRKDVGIDNLLVRPVPDPATGVLLLAGAAALLRRRRKS